MGRYGYGYGYAPCRTPAVIWSADFSALPLSTTANASELRAALAAMGLTLTRASAATVQTSASEVVTSGIGVDDPRVGQYGLVIEEARTNYNPNARSLATADGWTAGTVTYTANALASPDGTTSADREEVASGVFGRYRTILTATSSTTVSMWRRSGTAAVASHAWFILDGSNAASNQNDALGPTWERSALTIATPGGGVGPISTCDARTLGPPWNLTGGNRDVALDLIQVEVGKFATECILTTGAAATRAAENLTLAPNVSRSGFLALEWKLVSKAATGSYSVNTVPLWTGPNGDYIGFHGVNRNVLLYLGGVVYSSAAGAISWAAGDVVESFVSCGGGAAAVFKYRVNGGAVTTVVIASGGATPVLPTYTSGGVLLQSGSASCWLQRVRAYAPGRRPSWC